MGCGSSSANKSGEKSEETTNNAKPTEEKQTEEQPAVAEVPAKNEMSADSIRIGEMLKDVPLLHNFTSDQRQKLGNAMVEEVYEKDQPVFSEGDIGTKFYVIMEGEANVEVGASSETGKQIIGHLFKGDYFGETALQNEAPRGASIIACADGLKVLSLDKEHFNSIIGSSGVTFVKRRIGVTAEAGNRGANAPVDDAADAIDSHLAPPDAIREKTPEVYKLIYDTVTQSLLFTGLSDKHITAVINCMYRHEVPAGTSPVKQGDPGNNLFIVEQGVFDVFVDGVEEKVTSRGPGEIFGELALMYNAPRAATVTATENAVTWKVDRYTFRRIARDVGEETLRARVDFLSHVDLLSPLTTLERMKIAEAMDDVSFADDFEIFQFGDVGDAMYIIKEGTVVITIPDDETKTKKKRQSIVVNRTSVGDYFGERALLTDEPRAAKVKTVTRVEALCLKRHDFKLLLGPLTDIMTKRIKKYSAEEYAEPEEKAAEDGENQMIDLNFSDLQVVGTLGKGSFGHVQLVKHKETGVTYALKTVNKQQIVDTHQQEHIMSEKRVMMRMNNPFLIRLYQTFKDRNSLYFVLEPVMGGELFSLLRRRRLFKESTARFYAGCVISAFEYLHTKETVYRDLKPENLLLDDAGYIKITDFGFAKRIGTGKTWTLCGTPDYLAPEIVSGRGHGKGVDWWTVGVLIYEMVASYTPFYHQNQLKMYDKIVRGKYRFPSHFSRGAKQIVADLLEHKPTKRLGIINGGAAMIKTHEWFEGFDWDALESMQMASPIPIKIKDKLDLSNFDVYDDDQHEHVRPYRDDGTNWDQDF